MGLLSGAPSAPASAKRGGGLRIGLAVLALALVLWFLPERRAGEDGGHHGDHAGHGDPFERAGVTELADGQRGPGLRLPAFPARGVVTLEDFAGKLVVLNFWATWCPPCTAEMPTLEALWQEYRARGLVVVGVSVDRGAPRSLLEPYVAAHGLTFPILLDGDMAAARAWRVSSLPATFIVKPDGQVAGIAVGAREWNSGPMRALLEPMLPAARAESR